MYFFPVNVDCSAMKYLSNMVGTSGSYSVPLSSNWMQLPSVFYIFVFYHINLLSSCSFLFRMHVMLKRTIEPGHKYFGGKAYCISKESSQNSISAFSLHKSCSYLSCRPWQSYFLCKNSLFVIILEWFICGRALSVAILK